ncbi:ABC transporter ATP-binding protein [Streptomyces humi]|uniref:ABC transporter ATP-binding protein n=1 Tax=Streptomyces humi TaxID=1428620 RepID=UPI0009A0CA20|nr:ABC transporter ATP-binding protein [Streptomyces humi]
MIRFEDVSVTYEDAARPAVQGIDFEVPEGELVLLVGPSGTGKSTVLNSVSGLVPHFTGGTLRGRVTVAGRDTRTHPPRELADVVGTVGQDPLAHFVTDTVEDELAYGMESLGIAPGVMRRRVEETLDLLGLAELRDRQIATLSGGQRQRVAIGSVLTPHPRVLVLDEPTSALDPAAAEEVLAVLQRLVHDLGTTVLMAEHRLERVVQYADRVVLLPGAGAAPVTGTPAEVMAVSPVCPPVVQLGRLAGWSPLPMTVRDARRRAAALRDRLTDRSPRQQGTRVAHRPAERTPRHVTEQPPGTAPASLAVRVLNRLGGRAPEARRAGVPHQWPADGAAEAADGTAEPAGGAADPAAEVRGLAVRREGIDALRRVDLTVAPGETVALMGRNGAGKSTLLGALVGLVTPSAGGIRVGGAAPHRSRPRDLVRLVGLVPQEPRDLLYADTVGAECAAADRDAGAAPGTCRELVSGLLPGVADGTHPRDLSEGQRLALALAVVLTARPPLLLLDEPTRGLDYAAKARLVGVLRALAADGHAIVLATHDVELAAEIAHRVVLLADGEVIADGPTDDIVVSSPSFAPQVTKVLAPQRWLTVAQVREALGEAPTEAQPQAQAEAQTQAQTEAQAEAQTEGKTEGQTEEQTEGQTEEQTEQTEASA